MIARKIIDVMILLGAMAFLYLSIGQLIEAYYNPNKLIRHAGIVLGKEMKTEAGNDKQRSFLVIRLDNKHEYVTSKAPEYVDENLHEGDTIQLLTKPSSFFFSSYVSSETKVWTTKHSNEIYELTLTRDQSKLIDFEEHKRNLKSMLWGFPVASLAFLGWFIYRRSGRKSRFIIETGG